MSIDNNGRLATRSEAGRRNERQRKGGERMKGREKGKREISLFVQSLVCVNMSMLGQS